MSVTAIIRSCPPALENFQNSPGTNERRSERAPSFINTTGSMNGAGGDGQTRRNGRLPNYVQVAKSFVFEQSIQENLREIGVAQAREDSIRLAGVQWIDNVRRALKL